MKYMGSKRRIAKYIIPFTTKYLTDDKWYVEPFVGGCNMMDKVQHHSRIGSDVNPYLIDMWRGVLSGNTYPMEISKELYSTARDIYKRQSSEMSSDMLGWIGWMGSFNGKFFDGGYGGKTKDRDYIKEQINNTLNQLPKLMDVHFIHSSYNDLDIPDGSIIYCDPPYENTTGYVTSKSFNHTDFWQWCRDMTSNGYIVYISEYSAPDDFVSIWSMDVKTSLHATNTKVSTENLFIHQSLLHLHNNENPFF